MVIWREHVVNVWWTCGDHVLTCVEHVLNMCWTCGELVGNMWWTCGEHVVNMWWTCHQVVKMACTFCRTCREHGVNMSWGRGRGGPPPKKKLMTTNYVLRSKNLPNLVMYEIWRKNLTVSDRRSDEMTDDEWTVKVRYRGAKILKIYILNHVFHERRSLGVN